jgi:CHAT domain-containing protein
MGRIFAIFLFLFSVISITKAQTVTGDLSEVAKQAAANLGEKQYQKALELFDQILEKSKFQYTERERELYAQAIESAVTCCLELKDYVRAWEYCQQLEKSPSSAPVKMRMAELYVRAGTSYVQYKVTQKDADFLALHAVLQKIRPYTVKTELEAVNTLRSLLWYLMAGSYSREDRMDLAYECLLRAYDGYSEAAGKGLQANVLKYIHLFEQKSFKLLEERVRKDTLLNLDFLANLLYNTVSSDSTKRNYLFLANYLFVARETQSMQEETGRLVHYTAQFQLLKCYVQMGRFREAWNLGCQLLKGPLTEKERKKVSDWTLQAGKTMTAEYMNAVRPDYAGARRILETALLWTPDSASQEVHELIGDIWFQQGVSAFLAQNQEKAAEYYREALLAYQKGDSPQQGQALLYLAKTKLYSGKTEEASRLLSQAYELAAQDQKLKQEIANTMTLLSEERKDMKEYEKKAFLRDSLAVTQSSQVLLLEKGDRMLRLNNYALAEHYYCQSLLQVSPQNRNAGLFAFYTKMCHLNLIKGDYVQAEKYGRESFAVDLGAQSDVYKMNTWMVQATIYARQKDTKRFVYCYDMLRRLMEQGQVGARERANVYLSQALGYVMLQEWKEADEALQRSDDVLVAQYGKGDAGRARGLALWGGVLKKMGNWEKAYDVYSKGVELARSSSGERSVAYSEALEKLALLEIERGNQKQGLHLCMQAMNVLLDYVRSQLRYVPSTEREAFWIENSEMLWNMSAYALQTDRTNGAFMTACYDALLFSKSLLLETEKSQDELLKQEGNPESLRIFKELAALKEQAVNLERDEEHHKDSLAALHDRIQWLDHELTARSNAYADYTRFLDWDYQQVRKLLKDNELLVDFVDYISQKGEKQYAAYLIRKDREYPLLLRLFTQKELDALMLEKSADLLYEGAVSAEAVKLLWDKIRPHAVEGATIYYVPSGKLYQLAWESLSTGDGSLLGEHYRFVRLSSAREITRVHAVRESGHSAVLYGGLQYDMTGDEMLAESRKYSVGPQMVMRSTLRGDSAFVALPESGEEVCQIADILTSRKYQVQVHEGISGTEESFLSLSGRSPRILHLATHGFYFTPSEAVSYDYLRGFRDAMYLSGLVLSGGNAVWQGKKLPEGVLGGILTAQDISRLDLSGTELVVLSACQSGQGKVTPEGLFGLQRAFKKAGAQTLVMTLWRVSDRVTREFMVSFYKHLVHSEDKRKAFEEARQEIRDRYPEPFYWAGFVMID